MKRRVLLLIILFPLTMLLYGQVSLEVEAPSKVDMSDGYFQIKYTVNSLDVEDFIAPKMEGFKVEAQGPYSGAFKAVHQETSIINGHRTQKAFSKFTLTLVLTKKGQFTIPPAAVVVDGKTIRSKSISIEVTDHGITPNANSTQPLQNYGTKVNQKDLYITVTANKEKVYESEPVLLSYHFYAKSSIGFHNIYINKKPNFTDVVTHDLPLDYISKERVINGNDMYITGVCNKFLVVPQKSGTISLPRLSFDCELLRRDPSVDEMIDLFFNSGYIIQKVTRQSPEHVLEVLPLPQPQPSHFSGAVGDFTIHGELTTASLKTNDVATFRLVVEGIGNLKFLSTPEFTLPDGFDCYPPQVTEETTVSDEGIKGRMIYEYTFVPRQIGTFTVEPVEFVYFHPQSESYVSLKTDSLSLVVQKGKRSDEDYEQAMLLLGSDIRGLKPMQDSSVNLEWGSWTDWLVLLGLLMGYGVFNWAISLFMRKRGDVESTRRSKAARYALKRMKSAEKLLHKGSDKDYYAEVIRSLYGYLADKLNIGMSEINRSRIEQEFRNRQLPEEVFMHFSQVLETCEFAQYAPNVDAEKKENVFEEAIEAIVEVENALKTIAKKK